MYAVIRDTSKEGVMEMGRRAKCMKVSVYKDKCIALRTSQSQLFLCKVTASVASILSLRLRKRESHSELPGKLLGSHSFSKVFLYIF